MACKRSILKYETQLNVFWGSYNLWLLLETTKFLIFWGFWAPLRGGRYQHIGSALPKVTCSTCTFPLPPPVEIKSVGSRPLKYLWVASWVLLADSFGTCGMNAAQVTCGGCTFPVPPPLGGRACQWPARPSGGRRQSRKFPSVFLIGRPFKSFPKDSLAVAQKLCTLYLQIFIQISSVDRR